MRYKSLFIAVFLGFLAAMVLVGGLMRGVPWGSGDSGGAAAFSVVDGTALGGEPPVNPAGLPSEAMPFHGVLSDTSGTPVADGPYDMMFTIYNVLGAEVSRLVEQVQAAGRQQVVWNGRDETGRGVGAGVYFVRMRAGQTTWTRKLIVLN